jgi:hypothetical protein
MQLSPIFLFNLIKNPPITASPSVPDIPLRTVSPNFPSLTSCHSSSLPSRYSSQDIIPKFPLSNLLSLHFPPFQIFPSGHYPRSPPLYPPVTAPPSLPDIPLMTLTPKSPSLTSFRSRYSPQSLHNVRDDVPHPYRTTAKIIALQIPVFAFVLTANGKTECFELNGSKYCRLSKCP